MKYCEFTNCSNISLSHIVTVYNMFTRRRRYRWGLFCRVQNKEYNTLGRIAKYSTSLTSAWQFTKLFSHIIMLYRDSEKSNVTRG